MFRSAAGSILVHVGRNTVDDATPIDTENIQNGTLHPTYDLDR